MLIPESGRSPGEGHGKPLQYSCLENPIYRGAWQATVQRVAKSRTQLKQISMQAHAGFFFFFFFAISCSLWCLSVVLNVLWFCYHCRWWCSHEIKRCLLLGRKVMTNLDSILKSRDVTLPRKVHLVKAMVFPAVMYGCESWTIKKAEHQRIDAFELWCWSRLLRVPWTARRSSQSILKEVSPEYPLEELMQKLKLQSFGHLM